MLRSRSPQEEDTALTVAARFGKEAAVRVLIERGAFINVRDNVSASQPTASCRPCPLHAPNPPLSS